MTDRYSIPASTARKYKLFWWFMTTNERGQSTLEFLIVFVFAIGILLMYVQLAFGLAFGHYIHYATFMSARALFAADATAAKQVKNAEETLEGYLKRGTGGGDMIPQLARGVGGDGTIGGASVGASALLQGGPGKGVTAAARQFSWMWGVRYDFEEGYPEGYQITRSQYINGFYDYAKMPQAEKLFGLPEYQRSCNEPNGSCLR
jgi:hypothetical protein